MLQRFLELLIRPWPWSCLPLVLSREGAGGSEVHAVSHNIEVHKVKCAWETQDDVQHILIKCTVQTTKQL